MDAFPSGLSKVPELIQKTPNSLNQALPAFFPRVKPVHRQLPFSKDEGDG
jgi:hypothetical protein